ncbi:MAG TPA: hypothetical protein VL093_14970 [Flavipsychrobacter sp.]|nr:hypothetical protein [Flavipsychrobacter sp.]
MLQRIVAILILLVLLTGLGGYFVVFKVEQFALRREMKERIKSSLPESQLQHFAFSKQKTSTLDWERKGKEFRLDGDMYDIVRAETEGDTVHFYCLRDDKETKLFAGLDQLMKAQTTAGKSGKIAGGLLKIFFSFNSLPVGGYILPSYCFEDVRTFPLFILSTSTGVAEVYSPPPEHCI